MRRLVRVLLSTIVLGMVMLQSDLSAQGVDAASASAAASAPQAAASTVTFAPLVAVEPATLATAASPAPAPAKATATAQRHVNANWFDQPMGTDVRAWRFSAALEALGASAQAESLRRALLRRHLAQLAGEVVDPAQTVRQALAEGEALRTADTDPDLRARWTELVNRHLRVAVPTAAVPVPPELEADAARLREAAPGLWSLHAADGAVRGRVWWLLLSNQAPLPLPLAEFRVRAPAGPAHTVFDCSLPRYAEMALAAPGRDTAYRCRANAGAGSPLAWDELARLLRNSRVLPLQLEPIDLAGATPVQRVYQRLEAPHKAEADALAAATPATPAVGAQRQGAAGKAPARADAKSATAAKPAAGDARSGAGRARLWLMAGAALALYSLLATVTGRRAAMLFSWLALTALALVAVFKGIPGVWAAVPKADTWTASGLLLQLLMVLAALVVPAFATAALAGCYELLFGDRIGLLRALGRAVAGGLIGDLVDRMLDRRRRG